MGMCSDLPFPSFDCLVLSFLQRTSSNTHSNFKLLFFFEVYSLPKFPESDQILCIFLSGVCGSFSADPSFNCLTASIPRTPVTMEAAKGSSS